MKLLIGNGRRLLVYDVGDGPIYEVSARGPYHPVKFNGARVVEDGEARALVANLREAGYPCRKPGDAG